MSDGEHDLKNTSSQLDALLDDSDEERPSPPRIPRLNIAESVKASPEKVKSTPKWSHPKTSPSRPASISPVLPTDAPLNRVATPPLSGVLPADLQPATAMFTAAVNAAFEQAKSSISSELRAEFAARSLHLEATVKRLTAELQSTVASSAFAVRANKQRAQQVNGLLALVEKTRSVTADWFTQRFFLSAWRQRVQAGRERKAKMSLASSAGFSAVEGVVFREWRVRVLKTKTAKKIAAAKAQAEAERQAALREGEGLRQALLKENALLKEALRHEREARSAIQGDLRRVFIRGVNALNFEAMSVLSSEAVIASHPHTHQPQETTEWRAPSPKHKLKGGRQHFEIVDLPIANPPERQPETSASGLPHVTYVAPEGPRWQKASEGVVLLSTRGK